MLLSYHLMKIISIYFINQKLLSQLNKDYSLLKLKTAKNNRYSQVVVHTKKADYSAFFHIIFNFLTFLPEVTVDHSNNHLQYYHLVLYL